MKGVTALIAGYVMLAALAAPAVLPAADDADGDTATSSGAVVAPAPAPAEPEPDASASVKQTTHEVVMKDIEFVPKEITVDVGDTVTWRNEDSVDHNAIANDDSFSTENFGQGETASATINQSGTIPYFCSLHAGMKGTIRAVGGGSGGGGSGSGGDSAGTNDSGAGTGADDFLTDPGTTSPGTGAPTTPDASGGNSSLPLTGSDSVWLAIAGAWLLSVGAAIRAALSGAR